MSLRIIKSGVLDTIQDSGRYRFQHLGINPGGAMDRFASRAANILVGNNGHEALIELHFPSAILLFEQQALITLTGADFSATINGDPVPLWQPLLLAKNSILQFQRLKQGARCYLAIREKLNIPIWLNSYSTNLKAAAGGFCGRALQKNDVIPFQERHEYKNIFNQSDFVVLPWKANSWWNDQATEKVRVVAGKEWSWLSEKSKHRFLNHAFRIGSLADRMGYHLQTNLHASGNAELVSSAVTFGTIQLLPNGELIILMADHQTTGGYPRLGYVVSAHLPRLAQKQTGDTIHFALTTPQESEQLFFKQERHLRQLQNACRFRLEEFLNAHH